MRQSHCFGVLSTAFLLIALAAARPDGSSDMNMNIGREAENKPQSYFALGEHSGFILVQIILEVISWCFILPIAVMLSIAHSRYTVPVQFVFLIINAIALLFDIIYNTSTPDLYENNAHHKVGWIATWVMCAQVAISLIYAYSGRGRSTSRPDYARVDVSTRNITDNQRLYSPISEYRWSGGSGQGTVCPTTPEEEHFPKPDDEEEEEDIEMSTPLVRGLLRNRALDKFFTSPIPSLVSDRALGVLRIVYNVIDRIILPFGFVTLATGIVTYSATKWASERILERAGATLGIPSTIYRFCPATANKPAPKELLDMFAHFVDMTKAMPDATGWAGRMDMVPAANVASWLCESTFGNVTNNGVNFTHYPGKVSVSVDELMPYLEGQMSGRDDLTRVPLLKWTGVIKRAAFEYFMMFHEASIEKEAKLEMRR